jgi:hypothetical protein
MLRPHNAARWCSIAVQSSRTNAKTGRNVLSLVPLSRRFAVALVLSLLLPPVAGALPPPPPVAIVLIAPPALRDDSASLLQSVGSGAWFEMTTAPAGEEAFAHCANTADSESCVRDVLRAVEQRRPPPVAVVVSTGPGFHIAWRCIGVGETVTNADRQFVTFGTLVWHTAGGPSEADRQAAAGCVLAAASESGW